MADQWLDENGSAYAPSIKIYAQTDTRKKRSVAYFDVNDNKKLDEGDRIYLDIDELIKDDDITKFDGPQR